jgi:hypothetical protein
MRKKAVAELRRRSIEERPDLKTPSPPPILPPSATPAAEPPKSRSLADWIHHVFADEEPISGKVIDEKGLPIAGAAVGIALQEDIFSTHIQHVAEQAVTRSAPDGTFTIDEVQGEGPHLVWALFQGRAEGRVLNVLPGERGIIVRLQLQSGLRGVVVDDKGPVAGAHVGVLPTRQSPQELVGHLGIQTSTPIAAGPAGEFEVLGLGAGTYDLLAETADKRGGKIGGIVLQDGQVQSGLRVVVGEGGHVVGKVIDHDSGAIAPGAKALIIERLAKTKTLVGADGSFDIVGLPPGPLDLFVVADGYFPYQRWVILPEPGARADVGTIRLVRQTRSSMIAPGSTGLDICNTEGRDFVLRCWPDSPCDVAGVQVGDELVAIDGKDMTGVGAWAAIALLGGEPNTTVEVTVRSPSGQNQRTVRLERAAY